MIQNNKNSNDLNKIEERYVKEVYENIAIHFSNTRIYTWNWVKNFIENIPINSTIADIGCGNGRNMMNKNYNFIGIDNCENLLKICKKNNLNVLLSNMTNIPLNNNSCDAIICIAAFHHLYNETNRILCLQELNRILKDKGEILISVWSINQPPKTKRTFNNYGDNLISWNKFGNIYRRYYYIFQITEIYNLFKICGFLVKEHKYDCGNEIFILNKI